ncbi:zeta toxin family protein [bacterium]|nr:zeta toxin family protein [bacterium]
MSRRKLVLLAGPNGAGKSTLAPLLLRDTLEVVEFVNADLVAKGLSAYNTEGQAVAAGRIVLARLHELAEHRIDFAFESTLASRSFAPWIDRLCRSGRYDFQLVFLWLRSEEIALARVRARVEVGGHGVPDEVVRRRYDRGIRNFFSLYAPLAKSWRFYDNSGPRRRRLVAVGGARRAEKVSEARLWKRIKEEYGAE